MFDPKKPITLQCDASQRGLGAAIIQDGYPISYASWALTRAEKNYAQIEKELLAIVFGAHKFYEYIYGHTVCVDTDHKPLEIIFINLC